LLKWYGAGGALKNTAEDEKNIIRSQWQGQSYIDMAGGHFKNFT